MHIDDLAAFSGWGAEAGRSLRAVGWLSSTHPFSTGRISAEVYAKLKLLLVDPWQPFVSCGVHPCELCQFDGPLGGANLFVPDGTKILVCPELITHSIAAHHYRPPDEFLTAVINCPETRTMEYKRLLLASGGRSLVGECRG
ncbi:MAG: hypothetical protein C0478_05730 [Planctomyces sp.]|nr:hypothetical protein [Planctomyces sp.]